MELVDKIKPLLPMTGWRWMRGARRIHGVGIVVWLKRCVRRLEEQVTRKGVRWARVISESLHYY